jgi:hypothetical protein
MPARIIKAKPRISFSIREQHERNGLAAAVQMHTQGLEVHIATLVHTLRGIGTFGLLVRHGYFESLGPRH